MKMLLRIQIPSCPLFSYLVGSELDAISPFCLQTHWASGFWGKDVPLCLFRVMLAPHSLIKTVLTIIRLVIWTLFQGRWETGKGMCQRLQKTVDNGSIGPLGSTGVRSPWPLGFQLWTLMVSPKLENRCSLKTSAPCWPRLVKCISYLAPCTECKRFGA